MAVPVKFILQKEFTLDHGHDFLACLASNLRIDPMRFELDGVQFKDSEAVSELTVYIKYDHGNPQAVDSVIHTIKTEFNAYKHYNEGPLADGRFDDLLGFEVMEYCVPGERMNTDIAQRPAEHMPDSPLNVHNDRGKPMRVSTATLNALSQPMYQGGEQAPNLHSLDSPPMSPRGDDSDSDHSIGTYTPDAISPADLAIMGRDQKFQAQRTLVEVYDSDDSDDDEDGASSTPSRPLMPGIVREDTRRSEKLDPRLSIVPERSMTEEMHPQFAESYQPQYALSAESRLFNMHNADSHGDAIMNGGAASPDLPEPAMTPPPPPMKNVPEQEAEQEPPAPTPPPRASNAPLEPTLTDVREQAGSPAMPAPTISPPMPPPTSSPPPNSVTPVPRSVVDPDSIPGPVLELIDGDGEPSPEESQFMEEADRAVRISVIGIPPFAEQPEETPQELQPVQENGAGAPLTPPPVPAKQSLDAPPPVPAEQSLGAPQAHHKPEPSSGVSTETQVMRIQDMMKRFSITGKEASIRLAGKGEKSQRIAGMAHMFERPKEQPSSPPVEHNQHTQKSSKIASLQSMLSTRLAEAGDQAPPEGGVGVAAFDEQQQLRSSRAMSHASPRVATKLDKVGQRMPGLPDAGQPPVYENEEMHEQQEREQKAAYDELVYDTISNVMFGTPAPELNPATRQAAKSAVSPPLQHRQDMMVDPRSMRRDDGDMTDESVLRARAATVAVQQQGRYQTTLTNSKVDLSDSVPNDTVDEYEQQRERSMSKPSSRPSSKPGTPRQQSMRPTRVTTKEKKKHTAGWLYKKNPKGLPGMRPWKSRWCVIRRDRMDYYAHSNDVDPKGSIMLKRVVDVEHLTSTEQKHEGRFVVQVKGSKRIYEFRAPDADVCELWIAALEQAVRESKEEM